MINDGLKFGPVLEKYFSNGGDLPAVVISPFITTPVLQRVLGDVNDAIVVTSWRMDHLISGVSSLETYDLCSKKGWKLFINERLHAKIYSLGLCSCYAGSANVTEKALYDPDGNIEVLVYVSDVEVEDRIGISRIMLESLLVNDQIYAKYKLKLCDLVGREEELDLSPPDVPESLHIQYLPATDDPGAVIDAYMEHYNNLIPAVIHDIALFLNVEESDSENALSVMKESFSSNIFISKLESRITYEGISFGALSSTIHNMCEDIPAPYRKDVKIVTHNVMQWFCKLYPDKYEIVIPGKHSQVLRLRRSDKIMELCWTGQKGV